MSVSIKDLFSRITTQKKEIKDLKFNLLAGLKQQQVYQLLEEETKLFKEKLKSLENSWLAEQSMDDLTKFDGLKVSIKSDEELLSDMVIQKYMNGEQVEITDDLGVCYVPKVAAKLKKK